MYRAQVSEQLAHRTRDATIAGVQFGRSSNASLASEIPSARPVPAPFRPHKPFRSHLHYLPLPITSALVSAMGRVLLKVRLVCYRSLSTY